MYQGSLKRDKFPRRSSRILSGKMRESKVLNFRKINSGAVEAKKDFASSIKAATEVPHSSFQFYVFSDEGINLHVDLNSSPSDWTNRFRNEVRISENLKGNKSWSLLKDLRGLEENSRRGKSSLLSNTNSGQIDNCNGHVKSSSSMKLIKDNVAELDKQNRGSRPLKSHWLAPCSMNTKQEDNLLENQSSVSADLTVNAVDNEMQDQSTVEVSYGAPNSFISGSESCAKDLSKEIVDSGAANTTFSKTLCDSVGNSLSEPGKLELQNSKPDNKYYEDCALPNSSCIVSPGVGYAGASFSIYGALQNSEVASCNKYTLVSLCDNDGSLDLCYPKNASDMKQGGPVNSSDIHFVIDGNDFPSLIEEWEVGKTVDGRESSACSQFEDPLTKSCLESNDQDSKMELHRKRKNRDSEIQSSSDKPATRILRSMKNTAVMVLRRRSTRLISK